MHQGAFSQDLVADLPWILTKEPEKVVVMHRAQQFPMPIPFYLDARAIHKSLQTLTCHPISDGGTLLPGFSEAYRRKTGMSVGRKI